MKTFVDVLAEIGDTDKQTTHSYGPFYQTWLSELQGRTVNILEIGVSMFGGGSVLAFAEFLPWRRFTAWIYM